MDEDALLDLTLLYSSTTNEKQSIHDSSNIFGFFFYTWESFTSIDPRKECTRVSIKFDRVL